MKARKADQGGTESDKADLLKTRHIDLALGRRLRDYREAMGLNREAVAQALDVSVTRIQNYEEGHRIPASRLWQLCRLYGVEASALYEDLPHHVGGRVTELAEEPSGFENPFADPVIRAIAEAATDLNPAERSMALAALRGMAVRKFKRP